MLNFLLLKIDILFKVTLSLALKYISARFKLPCLWQNGEFAGPKQERKQLSTWFQPSITHSGVDCTLFSFHFFC